jgi:tryptophanyl-tRNA synthetase
MREFLTEHQEKRAEVETMLDDLDIELESSRRGVAGETGG